MTPESYPKGHKPRTLRFGRPVVYMRTCECGWMQKGYGSAQYAKQEWEAHIATVKK
jgi:hypothetical protein